jgi:hypothetical protein
MDIETNSRKEMAEAALDRLELMRAGAMARYVAGFTECKSEAYKMLAEAADLAAAKIRDHILASDFVGALAVADIREMELRHQHMAIFQTS